MTIANESKTITAENVFSDPIELTGEFNFSLSGDGVATIHLQRSFDGGATPVDVGSFHVHTQMVGNEPETGIWYRFGVKEGNYTSGPIVGRLSQ